MHRPDSFTVYWAQLLIGGAAAFLGPTVAAITLGIVGAQAFDIQFGKNQAFNSAGNFFMAVLVGYLSYRVGYRTIFVTSATMAIPALFSLLAIDPKQIDYAQARGSTHDGEHPQAEGIFDLAKDRVLLFFFLAVFLFHLANAAMLPQLGEMLSQNNRRAVGAFMSACVIVTQLVIAVSATWIGRKAGEKGRRRLLLFGFGVLPVRGVLYTLTHSTTLLIGIQILDGVANAIFVVVSVLVIVDRTQGTGRFNLASGALAATVGIGAALSNTIGGLLIQRFGFATSFLGLGGIALLAFLVLWFAVPETLPGYDRASSRLPVNQSRQYAEGGPAKC
jgi:predicted MFS family arabinose efflux permease